MSIRKVLFGLLLLGSSSVSAQDWSLGLDLISLGKVIGGEETPAVLQVRRSFNERHAIRVSLGAYHSDKRRELDYFNSGNGVHVRDDTYNEINFTYFGQLGWQYSLVHKTRFQFYTFAGALIEYSKNKRSHNPELGVRDPTGPPDDEPFRYKIVMFDNHKLSYGGGLNFGAEFKLLANLSLSLETDLRAVVYREKRYEQDLYLIFDWNPSNQRVSVFLDDGHYYDETGFEFRANAVQYLFLRYTF